MPKNPPLTDAERSMLMAGGGYGSIQQAIDTNEASLDSKANGAIDPYAQGKATPYPSKSLGYETFFPKTAYSRLGFNPFIDNYEKYKNNTTKWEDFQDAQHASSAMMWGMTSFFGIGGGDQSTYAAASDYEKLVDVGSPVGKTDTFSWALKQYVQAGYTKAIITSIVAEELALAAVTAGSRGKTAGVAWARTVKNFDRLLTIGDKIGDVKKFENLYDMSKMAKQTESARRVVDNVQDISKARSFWNNSRKMAGNAATKVGQGAKWSAKTVFPHAAGYVNAVKKGEYAMNGFANATAGFGAFYREMREFNLAFGEADLEMAFIQKDAMAQLTEKYRGENGGKSPDGKALENIQELASAVGSSGRLMNIGLIYGTNKFGFNSLFNKFAPRVASESIKASRYGKLFVNKANIKKGKVGSVDFVKKGTGFKGALGLNQMKYHMSNLKKSPLRSIKYLAKASAMGTTEGAQEYFQEVIQDAEIRRATESYGKVLDGNWLDYYGTSMNKFISPEGAEVFASGFFMGAFAGPHKLMMNKSADALHSGASYLSGNYKSSQETARDMQKRYEEQTKKINDMFQNPWSKDQALGALQKQRKQTEQGIAQDKAVEEGDENTFNHIVDDQTLETIYNALDKDVFDVLIDQIEQMDQLSNEEVLDAFKDVIGPDASQEEILEFKANAKTVLDNAKAIQKLKKEVDTRYINPFTYGVGEKDNDQTFGMNPYFMHNAFEYTKKQIVRDQYSYSKTLERQEAILNALRDNPPFWSNNKSISSTEFAILFNNADLANEISILRKELSVAKEVPTSDMTADQKAGLKRKQEKYDLLFGTTKTDAEGNKIKVPGIQQLLSDLNVAYQKDEYNENLKAEYKKRIEEGSIEGILGVGMPVTLSTKKGGKGIIVEDAGNHYKIKKENGKIVTVLKTNVSLDQEAALETLYNEDKEDSKTQETLDALHSRYKEYMTTLAKQDNNHVNDTALDASFQKLLDFYALKQDGNNLSQHLNMLMNPEGFENTLRRRAAVEEHIWKNKKSIIAESLQAAYEAKEFNFMLQELASEHNAFIVEEDALKIQDMAFTAVDLRIMELTFYDKTTIKPIDDTSPRHREAYADVAEYLTKRWKKQNAARTEYKVGDTINPIDILEDEEVANKIKAANKEKKTAVLISEVAEDGTAEIRLDDEIISVKLTPITKVEVTPDATTEKATPEQPAEVTITEISTETPFEEWTDENLKAEVQAMYDKYQQNMSENENLSEVAKEKILGQSIDDWIQSPEGRGRVTPLLTKYNASIKPAKAVVIPTIKTPAAKPPEKDEIIEDSSIRMDYPIAELELPVDVKNSIIAGKAKIITLGLSPSDTQSIVQALKTTDGSINNMKDVTVDKPSAVTLKVTDETGNKVDITLSYRAKQSAMTAASNNLDLAIKLGLPQTQQGVYKHPVKIGEVTFYASSKDQADWFDGGMQHVFVVSAQETYEEPTIDEEEKLSNWINEINTRLAETKTVSELNDVYEQLVTENEFNEIQLTADALESLKEDAMSNIGMTANQFSPGQAFIMADSLRKSGVTGEIIMGVVESISADSVTFKFPLSDDKTVVIPSKNLAKMIIKQTDPTQMNEELAKMGTDLNVDEQEAVKDSKDTADQLLDDAAEIKDALDKAENTSVEEVRDNFWNKTIKKDNC